MELRELGTLRRDGEDANEEVSTPEQQTDDVPPGGMDRAAYVDSLKLFLRMLPAALDHLSDVPVLMLLWRGGHRQLFWLGLAVDLLPGPVAAYQFYLLGHGALVSSLLLCHPINVFLWTPVALCRVSRAVEAFAKKAVGYCHESQALLESPMQVVLNLSLICHGILPAPWSRGDDHGGFVISSAFGNEVDLSFFPMISVLFSLASILFSAGRTVNLVENLTANPKRSLTWLLFLVSNILFRLQTWTVLATFLDVYAAPILAANFVLGLAAMVAAQDKSVRADPFLSAVYSLVFPVAPFMKSIHEADVIEAEIALIKRTQKALTVTGNCTMLLALWALYLLLPSLDYNHAGIIVSREVFFHLVWSSTLMGVVGIASTFFVSFPGAALAVVRRVSLIPVQAINKKFNLQEKKLMPQIFTTVRFTNWPLPEYTPRAKQLTSLAVRLLLILTVVLVAAAPYALPRQWNDVAIRATVCGEPLSRRGERDDLRLYRFGPASDSAVHGDIRRCENVGQEVEASLGENFELLVCADLADEDRTRLLLLDRAYSTRLPGTLDLHDVLLVREGSPQMPLLRRGIGYSAMCAGDPDLVTAARSGDLSRVRAFLDRGDPVDGVGPGGNAVTALAAAAAAGHLEAARLLVLAGADVGAATAVSGMAPLHFAAKAGDTALVQFLSDSGADVSVANTAGERPIYVAARHGKQDVVKRLIELGGDWKSARSDGRTPIFTALDGGHAATFDVLWGQLAEEDEDFRAAFMEREGGQLLILAAKGGLLGPTSVLTEAGADLEARDGVRSTALGRAAQGGHTEVCVYLISRGAYVDARDFLNYGPLHHAAELGNLNLTVTLVEAGANVSALCSYNKPVRRDRKRTGVSTPLLMAALWVHSPALVSYLLSRGADPAWKDDIGQNGLHKAAYRDREEVFEVLLGAGADWEDVDVDGNTPAHVAALNDSPRCLKVLVDSGRDLAGLRNAAGGTVLHDAAYEGSTRVIEYLMSVRPDVGLTMARTPDEGGAVPIHLAAVEGTVEGTRLLLADNASDPNAFSSQRSWRPLILASSNGHLEVARLLLEAGADVDGRGVGGVTAIFYTLGIERDDLTLLLLDAGADLAVKNFRDWTPLFAARSEEMARLLATRGANPTSVASDGNTLLHQAARRGAVGLARFALEYGVDPDVENRAGKTAVQVAEDAVLGEGDPDKSVSKEKFQQVRDFLKAHSTI